ncbi:hypothetical protein N7462_006383 [Penicillium macrosclerotiorum]|uniref:uncharacterized protein n=1 Tax=Penicillium macrosclerotiorum TaxID=303699 RepID=UPI002549476A|nr:uncharacterized protein N7462_006383 [Penicillium macrosclerotiorum]KAJ5683218.1 hypothetical protein N7462_006383 [Penicillium macrosclerotiorum]
MSDFDSLGSTATLDSEPTRGSLHIFIPHIFGGAVLVINACRVIYARYQARQRANDWTTPQCRLHFFLFVLLAVLSLGHTWYHMVSWFAQSYRHVMETRFPVEHQTLSLFSKMRLWLLNVRLFKEAYVAVTRSPAGFWWLEQTFLWSIGWSVFVGVMGRKYKIPYLWSYILIDQFVAPSFVFSLFFALILVSSKLPSGQSKGKADHDQDQPLSANSHLIYEILPVAGSLLCTVVVPFVGGTRYLVPLVLVPHVCVFIPVFARPSPSPVAFKAPAQIAYHREQDMSRYVAFFQAWFAISVLLQAHSTYVVLESLGGSANPALFPDFVRNLITTMYEHPAVTCCAWDAVHLIISVSAWALVNHGSLQRMLCRE